MTCQSNEVEILAGHMSNDHIHLLVSVPPHLSASKLVQYIKGSTSRKLRMEYKEWTNSFGDSIYVQEGTLYISSMRKTSREFNSETVIQNIWELCGEKASVDEIPYWETVNKYLEKLDPEELQDIVCRLVYRLVRSRAFADARIRNKYWQVIVDGTQIHSSRRKLDEKSLYRVHNMGSDKEYTEYYYYILEAKIVLYPDIIVSIITEFVENTDGEEAQKQDCERKACYRLMKRFKKEFPRLLSASVQTAFMHVKTFL